MFRFYTGAKVVYALTPDSACLSARRCLRFLRLCRGFSTLLALGGPVAIAPSYTSRFKFWWIPYVIGLGVGALLALLVSINRFDCNAMYVLAASHLCRSPGAARFHAAVVSTSRAPCLMIRLYYTASCVVICLFVVPVVPFLAESRDFS